MLKKTIGELDGIPKFGNRELLVVCAEFLHIRAYFFAV